MRPASLEERVTGAGVIAPHPSARQADPLPVEWFADIQPQLEGMWLVKRLLPAQGLALIYGHPGSGKSFFALDIALHVALGWEWAARRVKQGLVIYVGAEGGAGLRNRLAAFRIHHQLQGDIPFALIPTPIDMQDPNADTGRLAETIRMATRKSDAAPALVIIDTLSKTFGGGKENTDDMATYIANCQRIASEFDCLVMPVHHRPKDAESVEPRGHGSLKGGVDTVILIEAGKTKSAEVTKQKDGEIGERFLFNLGVVELGADEDGDAVTSCVVEHTATNLNAVVNPFAQAVGKLGDGDRLGYEALGDTIASQGQGVPNLIPDDEINRFSVGKVAELEAWRERFFARKGVPAGGQRGDKDYETARKAFDRAKNKLQTKGIVGVWGEFVWITHNIPGAAGTAGDAMGTLSGTARGHGDSGDMGL